MSQSAVCIEFLIHQSEKEDTVEYTLLLDDDNDGNIHFIPESNGERTGWNRYAYACLLRYEEELKLLDPKNPIEHKKYSREGMIKRVLDERRAKAEKRAKWS